MPKTVTKTEAAKPAKVEKAAVPAKKSIAKPVKKIDATAAVAAALASAPTPKAAAAAPVDKKAARAAERAARYPSAAKQEAEKKAGKKTREPGAPKEAAASKLPKSTVQFVARQMTKGKPIHVLSITARPTSGTRLMAHTHAALTLLGMLDASCPAVPASSVRAIMGDRAIAYHTKEVNFETGPDHTLRLTPAGRNKFLSRTIDGGLANGFLSMFLDGTVDPAIGVQPGQLAQVVL